MTRLSMLRIAGVCVMCVGLATSRSKTLAEDEDAVGLRLYGHRMPATFQGGPLDAMRKVVADRTPLTFRDSGLYCNAVEFSHGPDPTKPLAVTSLLSAQRAARPDTPWDFYIMQYPSLSHPTLVEEAASLIQEMVRNGKKIILRCDIGRLDDNPDVDKIEQRLVSRLEQIEPDWLYAITLGEEHIFWNGWTETLTRLYYRLKARWPNLPVYQWWTPMEAPGVRDKGGWVALPADGWIMNLYGIRKDVFEKKMLKFLETGVPVVHIAWASPKWMFHDKTGYTRNNWWEKVGRSVFDEQVRICREYNVPVAYFCCQISPPGTYEGWGGGPIRWGWYALDPVVRRWFLELEAIVSNFDYLPDEEIGFRVPTSGKYAWVYAKPQTVQVQFKLDDKERKRISWRMHFPDINTTPGEHEMSLSCKTPYLRVSYRLDQSALDLQGSFAVTSDTKTISVPIIFQLIPLKPVADWKLTADLWTQASLGGSASVAFSADGKTWSETINSDPKKLGQALSIDSSRTRAVEGTLPLWLKVTLRGAAGVKTSGASRLNYLEVSGSFVELAEAEPQSLTSFEVTVP